MGTSIRSFSEYFRRMGMVFVIIAMIIFFGLSNPTFLQVPNLIIILKNSAAVAIAGVGCLYVISSGGIDLSIGYMVSAVGIVVSVLTINTNMSPVLACIITLGIMCGLGAVNGLIVARIHVPPFISTLGFMSVYQGMAYILVNGKQIYGLPDSFRMLGQGTIGIMPVSVIVMICILALGWFILNKTYLGKYFRAVGGNEEAARLSGIRVESIKVLIYVLSALFASFAGIILLSRVFVGHPANGAGFEFDVITAVIIGGCSFSGGKAKIRHVIFGTLIICILNNGMIILGFGTYLQIIIRGIVLVAAASFDSIQSRRELVDMRRKSKEH